MRFTNIDFVPFSVGAMRADTNVDGTKTKHGYHVRRDIEPGKPWQAIVKGIVIKSGSLAACLEACEDNER
jgi:hypothetical protein